MRKILILSGALVLLAGPAANAQVSVTFGEPAVYAAPVVEPGYVVAPDWPSQHYDIHRHRHNDYWAHRGHEEAARGERRR